MLRDSADNSVNIDATITDELRREGLMREVVRNVQNARKLAGLQVDDRIELVLITDDSELSQAVEEHKDTITAESLAVGLTNGSMGHLFQAEVQVEGKNLTIELEKAK
jgi:isoleucyl-tRNA synthetase